MRYTHENALNEYLEYIKLKLKDNTFETKERRIKKHIKPFFNDKSIIKTTIRDILEWQILLEKNNFKYNYKSSIFYTLSDYYEFLNKFYNVENIVKKVGNFKNNDIQDNGNIWSIDEFKKFISVINEKKYKVLFDLLYFTGLRKGEALALTFKDLVNDKLIINKTITRKHIIHSPKTKSSNRIISLDDLLLKELKELKKDSSEDELIFKISFTQLKRKKDYYCDLAGVKKIKIHEFRHSHACLLFMNDVPIDEISHRLGHSKLSITTDTYLKYIPLKEKRVINTLNSLHFN